MTVPQKQSGFTVYLLFGVKPDGEEELVEASDSLEVVSRAYNGLLNNIDGGRSEFESARIEA